MIVPGQIRSGKTTVLKLMAGSIIPLIGATNTAGEQYDFHCIWYDPKGEALATLSALGSHAPIHVLNPFDAQSKRYAIAEDCTTQADILQLAVALFPYEKGGENRFFTDAAREVLGGILTVLNERCPCRWDLRHVLLIARQPSWLKHVLTQSRQTAHIADTLFGCESDPRTTANVLSTVMAQLGSLTPAVAAASHAMETISISRWLREHSILVLPDDQNAPEAMKPLSRLILAALKQKILSLPDNPPGAPEASQRRIFFFLDEFPEVGGGRIEGFEHLLALGRTKGTAFFLLFQSYSQLIKAYDKETANIILSQCANILALRMRDPETCQTFSSQFGKYEGYQWETSESSGYGGGGSSSQVGAAWRMGERRVILPDQFAALPPADFIQNGIHGYALSPWIERSWSFHVRPQDLHAKVLSRYPAAAVINFLSRDPKCQRLEPMAPDDWDTLGIKPPPGVPSRIHSTRSAESLDPVSRLSTAQAGDGCPTSETIRLPGLSLPSHPPSPLLSVKRYRLNDPTSDGQEWLLHESSPDANTNKEPEDCHELRDYSTDEGAA